MNPVWIAFAGLAFTVTMAMLTGAFHMGKLSQRVSDVEDTLRKESGTHDDVIRLGVKMETALTDIGSVKTSVASLQRQIATLMGRKDARIIEMPETGV